MCSLGGVGGVQDQEGQTRRLFEFVGLEFEAGTLEFYKKSGARTVITASVAQVGPTSQDNSII